MQELLSKAEQMLSSSPPKMDEKRLGIFIDSCLKHKDIFLDLARQHGSPLYALDEKRLRSKATLFRQAFSQAIGNVDVFYAMKSNNMPDVTRILVDADFGLDVSSGLELQQAITVGAQRIIFSGPGKTHEELSAALDHAERVTILLDSFGELARLDRLAVQRKQKIQAGVRLTTNPNGLWRKFGILLESLPDFFCQAQKSTFVDLCGLQFHTSWNLSPAVHTDFLKQLGQQLCAFPLELQNRIRFIDMGGGFWPVQGEWLRPKGTPSGQLMDLLDPATMDPMARHCLESTPINVFAQAIARTIKTIFPKDLNCRFYCEPGRWICHEAMHLLMTVVDVKAPDLIITDAGTNAVGWERFEHDYFPVINLTRPGLEEKPCHVLGSLCTPHDVWGFSYHGSDIQPGDLLLIPTQGAYTYSLRQNFIKPLPRIAYLSNEVILE